MTLHILVPVQVGENMPGRKTSEIPLDNITVLGKMRHGLDRIAFNLVFTELQFCIILLPGCSLLPTWLQTSLERHQVKGKQILCQNQHPETTGYKDHYETLKNKKCEIVLSMWSNWKMDDNPSITLKLKPLFWMLIPTVLATIFIWLLISWQTC